MESIQRLFSPAGLGRLTVCSLPWTLTSLHLEPLGLNRSTVGGGQSRSGESAQSFSSWAGAPRAEAEGPAGREA